MLFRSMTVDVVDRVLRRIAALVVDIIADAQNVYNSAVQRELISLKNIFAQVIQDAGSERGIEVRAEVDDSVTLEADAGLLVSALGNLLQNAIKYTHDNESITLRAISVDHAVSIEVEDHCGGLPDGSEEELFQPFVTDGRGAGLGLAIARRAVEAHGGTLSVRNLPGTGCVFAISIPTLH